MFMASVLYKLCSPFLLSVIYSVVHLMNFFYETPLLCMSMLKCSPNIHCVPAVELVVVGTLVGVKCASPKKSYRLLGAGHELSVNLISRYILIK